jgi:adenylate cyclase class 2
MLEIEVKIRVDDPEALRRVLAERGAKIFKPRYFEENTLYDFRDGTISGRKHALRLRVVGRKAFLTYKGAVVKSRKFKIREEFETEVKSRADIRKILKSLGLVPVYKYNKHREVYRWKHLKICLDETSVGVFLELEGKRSDIVRFAQAIGFDKTAFIKSNYIEMMEKAKAGNGA